MKVSVLLGLGNLKRKKERVKLGNGNMKEEKTEGKRCLKECETKESNMGNLNGLVTFHSLFSV